MTKTDKLWVTLTRTKRCVFCKAKFPNGIVNKHPSKLFTFNAMNVFLPEYLAHVAQTHGYNPDILDILFSRMNNQPK